MLYKSALDWYSEAVNDEHILHWSYSYLSKVNMMTICAASLCSFNEIILSVVYHTQISSPTNRQNVLVDDSNFFSQLAPLMKNCLLTNLD